MGVWKKRIIIIVIIAFLLVYFKSKSTGIDLGINLFKTPVQMKFESNIVKLSQFYSPDILKNMERIFRLETSHFKSKQFLATYSAGMEKFSDYYPFGWKTLDNIFWKKFPEYAPKTFVPFTENRTGKTKYFLKFPSLFASMITMCEFLKHYGNNPGRWYSLKPEKQKIYNESINKIIPKFSIKHV